jgi:hypothetical protein
VNAGRKEGAVQIHYYSLTFCSFYILNSCHFYFIFIVIFEQNCISKLFSIIVVWNIKSQKERLVKLIPSDTWGGAGLLGVTIRLDNYQGAEERLIRVLEVEPKSPASVAGLVPEKDFLLGTTTQTMDSVSTLAALLRQHENVVMDLYVYNSESDMVRVVVIMPTLSWGGRGLLGAELGTGYLHRLPKASAATVGASVQRKVRYVGTTASPKIAASAAPDTYAGTSGNGNSNGGGGGDNTSSPFKNRTTRVNMSPNDPSKGTALVEVEPQMEMEHHEYESEDEEEVSQPVLIQKQRQQQAQDMAVARELADAALSRGSGSPNGNGNTNQSAAEQQEFLQQLQQRLPPPPPLEVEVKDEQFLYHPPPSPHQLPRGKIGGAPQMPYPTNIQWNRSRDSYSGASTDGESSIADEHPVRTASPVKFSRVKIASPPSSVPGAFSSVVAIFSKPPPKGGMPTIAPLESSSPAGYVKSVVSPAAVAAAAGFAAKKVSPKTTPGATGFTTTTTTTAAADRFLPPPPMMHFVSPKRSTTGTTTK